MGDEISHEVRGRARLRGFRRTKLKIETPLPPCTVAPCGVAVIEYTAVITARR